MWWTLKMIPLHITAHLYFICSTKAGNKNPRYNTSSHQGAVMQGAMYPTMDAARSLNSGLINWLTTDSWACSKIGVGKIHWLRKSAMLKNQDDTKYPPMVHHTHWFSLKFCEYQVLSKKDWGRGMSRRIDPPMTIQLKCPNKTHSARCMATVIGK